MPDEDDSEIEHVSSNVNPFSPQPHIVHIPPTFNDKMPQEDKMMSQEKEEEDETSSENDSDDVVFSQDKLYSDG